MAVRQGLFGPLRFSPFHRQAAAFCTSRKWNFGEIERYFTPVDPEIKGDSIYNNNA
ncbi:hypothetical protein NIES23_61950 (plasmid) [Trichormus variabilis NIES-23]|uniref:Uncharacterized protein n=1 Tax=Trichormus variabilis NIES-23 TaxID=1973479 RepID=A0A1Z4KWP5_ANAVA|nr:hypothetical protein NIES23_61950 [Trichormus variabilis NIES-23]